MDIVDVAKRYSKLKVPDFEDPSAAQTFLTPVGLQITESPPPNFSISDGLLSKLESYSLFCAYHYIKWLYFQKREQSVLQLLLVIRGRLWNSNRRLVPFCMERSLYIDDIDAMRSTGDFALLRSVDGYDPWLGWAFGTYACRIIQTSIFGVDGRKQVPLEYRAQESLETRNDKTTDKVDNREQYDKVGVIINNGVLSNNEREIIIRTFLLEQRLKTIMADTGLCANTVRRTRVRALEKILNVLLAQEA